MSVMERIGESLAEEGWKAGKGERWM